MPYKPRYYSWCTDVLDTQYSAKAEAQSICDEMHKNFKNCTTIFDETCDGSHYKLCKEGAAIRTSYNGSCTYSTLGNMNYSIVRSVILTYRI